MKETAADGARNTGPALEAHYRFLLWLAPAVERFPRSRKFLLGDRIQNTALDVLESLIEATCNRQRAPHLARANLGLEKLRFLMRLAHDLGHPDHRRYEHAARRLDETGRKVGAWSRTYRASEAAPRAPSSTSTARASARDPQGPLLRRCARLRGRARDGDASRGDVSVMRGAVPAMRGGSAGRAVLFEARIRGFLYHPVGQGKFDGASAGGEPGMMTRASAEAGVCATRAPRSRRGRGWAARLGSVVLACAFAGAGEAQENYDGLSHAVDGITGEIVKQLEERGMLGKETGVKVLIRTSHFSTEDETGNILPLPKRLYSMFRKELLRHQGVQPVSGTENDNRAITLWGKWNFETGSLRLSVNIVQLIGKNETPTLASGGGAGAA